MEQIGEVVELKGKRAVIRIYRASSCGENCAGCSGECKPTATMVEANNTVSAKVGDTVKLQMNSASFILLSFIGYILPILVCIAVYFIAEKLSGSILIADLSAIFSLVAVLVVFFLLDKVPHKSTKFSSRIVKILN